MVKWLGDLRSLFCCSMSYFRLRGLGSACTYQYPRRYQRLSFVPSSIYANCLEYST